MFEVNEFIKYMMPLDADYSYGVILELKKGRAVVELKTYPVGSVVEIPYRFIGHVGKGGDGSGSRKGENHK